MNNIYVTTQGDTWDLIAYKLWESEYLFTLLLEANPKYKDVVVFSANVELVVPEIEEDIYDDRPDWLEDDE